MNQETTRIDYLKSTYSTAVQLKSSLKGYFKKSDYTWKDVAALAETKPEAFSLEQRQFIEAIKRMESLGLTEYEINHFLATGMPLLHDQSLFSIDGDAILEIAQLEQEYGGLVYAVVRADTSFGRMDSLLYVCKTESEWEMDKEDISDGILMTYTVNQDAPEFSEFGSIGYRLSEQNCIVRTS